MLQQSLGAPFDLAKVDLKAIGGAIIGILDDTVALGIEISKELNCGYEEEEMSIWMGW
jgi:hypothetical protein